MSMSIAARPAAAAASRATLPALCPWRTIQSFSGHLCLTRETKREGGKGSEQAFRLQPGAQIGGSGEKMGGHSDGERGIDVDRAVVDEQSVGGAQPEAVEREP